MERREFLWTTAAAASSVFAGSRSGSSGRRRRYARTPFGRIAYLEKGRGPGALFLHGFPLSGFQWRGAIDRLPDIRRCVAPDFLGLGDTEVNPAQNVDPGSQASMLAAFLDAIGMPVADVVASDSGGAVAQIFLTRYPQRVRSLLLTNCDAEPDSPPPALLPVIELARAGKFADEWLGRWLADKRLARSAEGIGGMCYASGSHPTDEAIECYFAPVLRSPARKQLLHRYATALERNALQGIGPALKASNVPVRIVWGTADTIFSASSAEFLNQAFGNSRGVRRLPGSKLFWPEERPEVVAEEARRLWAANGKG